MHSEEYWNLMRAKYAFKVQKESDVLAIIGMNQENICRKMKNKARAIKKNLYIGGNLTKDCFIDLMNDPDFSVVKWSITLKKPGLFDSGWNFYIEGWHLRYTKDAKVKNIKPLTEKQYELLSISGKDSSLLFWSGGSRIECWIDRFGNVKGRRYA